MKHAHPHRLATSRGFTLVESIIVLVVLGIAAVGIISLQGRIFSGQSDMKDMQVGVQLMQECAEHILGARRAPGYVWTTDTACIRSSLTTATYTVPAANTSGCPPSGTCKLVSITQGGLTPITLLLVSY